MSGEKNPEVAGCSASIMKDVWEIRARDYSQKIQMEQERMEKSALPSINRDWANRLAGKQGNKIVAKKPELDKSQKDSENIWKSKHTQVPPRIAGSSVPSKPWGQKRSISSQAPNVRDKNKPKKNRLQLLMSISQCQPSAMVWGKSWKCNKNLTPGEGATVRLDWGQCWMFATQQPYNEEGKPWSNGPNIKDVQSLDLWKKPDPIVMHSQDIELGLPAEEWETSWRKSDNNNKEDASSANRKNGFKSVFFPLLGETQLYTKTCSSEWSESWRSIKPSSQQECPNDELRNELVASKQKESKGKSCRWRECWRLVNHHGCTGSELPQVEDSHSVEWDHSWKAAGLAWNNQKKEALSLSQDQALSYDCSQVREPPLQTTVLTFRNHKRRYLWPCEEAEVLNEWNKSWLMVKHNHKPTKDLANISNTVPSKKEPLNVKEIKNEREKPDEEIYRAKKNITTSSLFPEGKHIKQSKTNADVSNTAAVRIWENSHKFVTRGSAQMCKAPTDPRVIITKEIKTKNHSYSITEKEKQSSKKWVGCHLLCKIQPQSKKSSVPVQKLMMMEDETKNKFAEEWAESWRFFVQPGGVNSIIGVKPLLGWNESWKLLRPPHRPTYNDKGRN